MAYMLLNSDEQDDTLVLFMASQERDQFTHTINKARYEAMLLTLSPGPFRDRIQTLLDETNQRLAEVKAIIAATVPQMPSAPKIATSLTRLKAKGML